MRALKFIILLYAMSFTMMAFADSKIGFIDVERIFRESAPAEQALQKLKKEFAPRDQELQKLQQQIKALQAQLEKDGLTMSESDRRAKEQDLTRMGMDFQRKQRDLQADASQRQNEEFAQLRERAGKIIRQIGESEKYDLIITDAVYRSSSIDITDKVLKALTDDK